MGKYPFVQAKKISYGGERPLSGIRYIVIHYTGNDSKTDTAKNEASYFHREDGNQRNAGAHFFVDQNGDVYQTIKLKYKAWSVGGDIVTTKNGAASLHGICTNTNSVSIELCDCAKKDPSEKMIEAVKGVISYIRERCPNAKTTVRHFDCTGKSCPGRMTDATAAGKKRWADFLEAIGEAGEVEVKAPTKDLKFGDEGEQVKRLQRCLNKLDKAGLRVDGSFGPATLRAVNIFKAKHGMNGKTGKVGPKTRAKIRSLL